MRGFNALFFLLPYVDTFHNENIFAPKEDLHQKTRFLHQNKDTREFSLNQSKNRKMANNSHQNNVITENMNIITKTFVPKITTA